MKKKLGIVILIFSTFSFYYLNATSEVKINYDSHILLSKKFNWNQKLSKLANSTWIIEHDYDLEENKIYMPDNVTLLFKGGSISNGTIVGKKTKIDAPITQIFNTSLELKDDFIYDAFYPEWFGAKGDGLTDDYKFLNKTFQTAKFISLTRKYNIASDSQIIVNRPGKLTLLGNNNIITNNSNKHLNNTLFVFKRLDTLIIKGINIKGKKKIANAFWIDNIEQVILENLTIENLLNISKGYRGIGLKIDARKNINVFGKNIKISEIGGGQDGKINSSLGIARALYIKLNYVNDKRNKTNITFEDSTFEWVYGDDGDVIDIIDTKYISDSENRFIFKNCNIKYGSRRLVKGSASGIQYYNCNFDTANEEILTKKMNGIKPQPSGGVNFRNANTKDFSNFLNKNGKMINCIYKNNGKLKSGLGNNVVITYSDGIEIRGTKFFNSTVRIQSLNGSYAIIGNEFTNSNIDLDVKKWTHINSSKHSHISNNIGYFIAPITPFALITSNCDLINLRINSNKIYSDEKGDSNFFGLIRHVNPKMIGKNITVSKNIINRKNSKRNELFISTVNWDKSCKIYENSNNKTGILAGSNFTSGAIFKGSSWGNKDGKGKLTN